MKVSLVRSGVTLFRFHAVSGPNGRGQGDGGRHDGWNTAGPPSCTGKRGSLAVGQEMSEHSSGRKKMVGVPLLLRMLLWFP
jgi:hypothetical protein